MSGWNASDPPCATCTDSGFAGAHVPGWGVLALIECPDCYPYRTYSYWHEMWVRGKEASGQSLRPMGCGQEHGSKMQAEA